MSDSFSYDVAISYLADDEALAREIAKSLVNLKVFVYSERQVEIAGTDGAETFSNVFARVARIVAVLYREKWGTTKWTRIEETAIKNRVFSDGADFLTFIHLEPPKPTPQWLPATRIWADLERLGLEGVVSIIEERVRQAGGAVREETAEENAARLRQEQQNEAKRVAFLMSDAGVVAARELAAALFSQLERIAKAIPISFEQGDTGVALYQDGFTVEVFWVYHASNSLRDSVLYVIEWRGRPNFRGQRYAQTKAPTELKRHELDFHVEQGEHVWRDRKTERLFSPDRLADVVVKLLLERVRKDIATRR